MVIAVRNIFSSDAISIFSGISLFVSCRILWGKGALTELVLLLLLSGFIVLSVYKVAGKAK